MERNARVTRLLGSRNWFDSQKLVASSHTSGGSSEQASDESEAISSLVRDSPVAALHPSSSSSLSA